MILRMKFCTSTDPDDFGEILRHFCRYWSTITIKYQIYVFRLQQCGTNNGKNNNKIENRLVGIIFLKNQISINVYRYSFKNSVKTQMSKLYLEKDGRYFFKNRLDKVKNNQYLNYLLKFICIKNGTFLNCGEHYTGEI